MTNDIVDRLRLYAERQKQTRSTVLGLLLSDSADEIERLHRDYSCICGEMRRMMEERDSARLQTGRILNEIDCRIEHGADSNGHLEAIYNLFKENSNV